MKNIVISLLIVFSLFGCAYNETINNYTINGNENSLETTQTSSTSKPVDVTTDMAGSGYGNVSK